MPKNNLERDEQYQHLLDLKKKVSSLDTVISEGQYAEEFCNQHSFWPIFKKTLESLKESYAAETHKAARDNRAEIANFLGREEGIMDVLNIIQEFSTRADQAESEKKLAVDEIKELTEILASPEGDTVDVGRAMG